jgi:hypothetical protein
MRSESEFAEFVAGALPGLLRFDHALTGNAQEAEDLVQTALGRTCAPGGCGGSTIPGPLSARSRSTATRPGTAGTVAGNG